MKKLSYLFILLFITSCTIQKRVHLKGYYVSWNGGRYKTEKNKELDKTEVLEHATPDSDTIPTVKNKLDSDQAPAVPVYVQSEEVKTNEQSRIISDHTTTNENPSAGTNSTTQALEKSADVNNENLPEKQNSVHEESKKINKVAVLGFVFGLLALIIGFAPIPVTPLTLLVFILCLLLGFIFSITGIVQVSKGIGKGLAFAIIGFVASLLTILISLLVLSAV